MQTRVDKNVKSFSCYSPEQMLLLEADCSCETVMTIMMRDLKREKAGGETKKTTQAFFQHEAAHGTDLLQNRPRLAELFLLFRLV